MKLRTLRTRSVIKKTPSQTSNVKSFQPIQKMIKSVLSSIRKSNSLSALSPNNKRRNLTTQPSSRLRSVTTMPHSEKSKASTKNKSDPWISRSMRPMKNSLITRASGKTLSKGTPLRNNSGKISRLTWRTMLLSIRDNTLRCKRPLKSSRLRANKRSKSCSLSFRIKSRANDSVKKNSHPHLRKRTTLSNHLKTHLRKK